MNLRLKREQLLLEDLFQTLCAPLAFDQFSDERPKISQLLFQRYDSSPQITLGKPGEVLVRKIRDCPSESCNFGGLVSFQLLLGYQLCIKDRQPLPQSCVFLHELKLFPAMEESTLVPGLILRLLDDPVTSYRAVD